MADGAGVLCAHRAMPADWRRPNMAQPWRLSSRAKTKASDCTCLSTKRGRSCKALVDGLGTGGETTTLICDNMAAQVMREGKVQAVIVGADRITANGDAANKIGASRVAVLAQAHEIRFMWRRRARRSI